MNFSETHKEQAPAGTPKISVIVPVYKVEKYLAECIESVLAQTFRDFELILVDDGSPDDCGKICDDYAARDSRVRVFHKENGGVTSARRLGVERSRADWITFVDADDIIFPNALADLLNIVETEEKSGDPVDLAQMGIVRFSGVPEIAYAKTGGGISPQIPKRFADTATYSEGLANGKWPCGPFAKIFRKSLLTSYVMSVPATFNIGEDLLMNQRAANGLRRAVMIPCSIYGYRQREDSAIHVRKVSNSYNKRFYEECIRCIAELPVSDAKKERIRRQYALSNLKCFISAGTVDIDRDFWLSEVRSIRKFSLRGDSPFIMSAIIRLRAQRFRIVRRIPHIPRYLCAVRQAILKMYLALLKK